MCTGKCSTCIAVSLYPLVLLSILCNIILFFPAASTKYAKDGHITQEVKYMGGLLGGGIMVLIPALYIQMTGPNKCCDHRAGMFLSVAFAAVGVVGALYSFLVAALGLHNGPLCKDMDGDWTTPFKTSNTTYLVDAAMWKECTEPKNIVQFHVGLFITLLAISGLQGFLCISQAINGLVGCLTGAVRVVVIRRAARRAPPAVEVPG